MIHYHVTTLSFYIDKELPEDKMEELRNHLAQCRACREEVAGLKVVDEIVRDGL